jgi:hypothetical protein
MSAKPQYSRLTPQGILVTDPTKVINTTINTTINSTSTGNGIFDQMTTADTYRDPIADLYTRITKLELNEKLLRLKILGLEDKFTQEEISNIRKMLMSEDEASRTLADSIIENA